MIEIEATGLQYALYYLTLCFSIYGQIYVLSLSMSQRYPTLTIFGFIYLTLIHDPLVKILYVQHLKAAVYYSATPMLMIAHSIPFSSAKTQPIHIAHSTPMAAFLLSQL